MPHDRTLDHYGTELASTAVLAAPVGRYAVLTSVQDVLTDLDARLAFMEANPGTIVKSFSADAHILKVFTFTADAVIHQGGNGSFAADASIHGAVTKTFTMGAYLIDHVN